MFLTGDKTLYYTCEECSKGRFYIFCSGAFVADH